MILFYTTLFVHKEMNSTLNITIQGRQDDDDEDEESDDSN